MAGDWIKMSHDISTKPEVVALASQLGMDRFAVVGRLHEIWCWFDRHTSDGNARGVTQAFLDSLVDAEGFASALASVGWLEARDGAIRMPNFGRHLSKSAKQRALGQERSQRFRNAAGVTKPSPEKRREEKRVIPPKPPFGTDGYTIAFEMAWSCYPSHRRSGKSTAIAAWRNAVGSLQGRNDWDIKQAEGWLLDRVKAFAKTPAASTKFCWSISKWLEEGHYDDAAEAWNGQQQAKLPTPEEQARWTPTGGVD